MKINFIENKIYRNIGESKSNLLLFGGVRDASTYKMPINLPPIAT
ncbi:hypothetical protein N8772_03835 [Rickettsiales bacterium]|nr:hypothetical protein [Rickettsiales bacterium]